MADRVPWEITLKTWDDGGENKKKVSELHKGDTFRCVSGREWVYLRPDQALFGVYVVQEIGTGKIDCFAGCALVLLLTSKRTKG